MSISRLSKKVLIIIIATEFICHQGQIEANQIDNGLIMAPSAVALPLYVGFVVVGRCSQHTCAPSHCANL